METLGWIADTSIQEFTKISNTSVVTGHWNDSVIDILKLMHEKDISSIALVNDHHQLISSMSLSDIKVKWTILEDIRAGCYRE